MSAPRRVGPYQLVERLGRGGMGEVWLAEDPTGAAGGAPRRVALKLLDPGLVDDAAARARFAREVAAAGRVSGPTVAPLLDADVEAPQPWLASAYVAGPTLDQHVERHGPLGPGPLRALGEALADALVHIHAAGVVHRDLTPRNVLLGPDGPRVVDFGIAWFAGAPPVTQAGSWVGTPSWMPPERLTGGPDTAAGDVWSWGAVMAYAARGWPVASGPADASARKVMAGDLDLRRLPPWLEGPLRAALATDPAARPTAAALRAAMSAGVAPAVTVPEGVPPTAVEPGPPATRVAPPEPVAGEGAGVERAVARWLSALAVLAVAAVVGLLADLLVTVIVVAVLVVTAVGLGLAREQAPVEARPIPPTWAVGLAGPLALGVGVAQIVGPIGGVAVVLALIALFFLLGGDIA